MRSIHKSRKNTEKLSSKAPSSKPPSSKAPTKLSKRFLELLNTQPVTTTPPKRTFKSKPRIKLLSKWNANKTKALPKKTFKSKPRIKLLSKWNANKTEAPR